MALINTNTSEKQEYYARAKLIQSQKEQLNMVKEEIDNVKIEMSEIKQLLQLLISKQ
jgi:gluconate kinase